LSRRFYLLAAKLPRAWAKILGGSVRKAPTSLTRIKRLPGQHAGFALANSLKNWTRPPYAGSSTCFFLACFLALLMVSTIPYANIKEELALVKRRPFSVLLLSIVGIVLVVAETEMLFFTTLVVYTASGPIESLVLYWRKKRKKSTQPEIKIVQEIKSIGQKSSERSEEEKRGGIF